MAGTQYDTGDVVATPDGRSVVTAVLTEQFYFPQEGNDDEYEQVPATADQPAHVVGLETVGSAPYRASALKATDLKPTTYRRSKANISPISSMRTFPVSTIFPRDGTATAFSNIGRKSAVHGKSASTI